MALKRYNGTSWDLIAGGCTLGTIKTKMVKGTTNTVSAGDENWQFITITPDSGYILIGYGGAFSGKNGMVLVSNRVGDFSSSSMTVQVGARNVTSAAISSVTPEAYAMEMKVE